MSKNKQKKAKIQRKVEFFTYFVKEKYIKAVYNKIGYGKNRRSF